MDGYLLVNKPTGMSTFDVIRRFKKLSDFKGKVGHGGTLDVFASGLVVLLLGKATVDFANFQQMQKTYRAGVRLGASTPTLDIEGSFTEQIDRPRPSRDEITEAMQSFIGKINQKVPSFSAAKQGGKALYELARAGEEIEEKWKEVEIYSMDLIAMTPPLLSFEATVSSGTYVRQLGYDVFAKLGVESFLYFLERRRIGEYTLAQACEISDFSTDKWQESVVPQLQ